MLFGFIIFIVIFIVLVSYSYNKLQRTAQRVKADLSNISVTLQKKVNLVNQLIDVVKNHENGEQLVHLTISKNSTQSDVTSSHMETNRALVGVQGFVQNFPDLKTSQQYNHLMHSIDQIENEISFQREKYNDSVREYNSERSTIPTVFVASFLKFPEAPYLDFSQENIEQSILKDFNTDSGERLSHLFDATKTNLLENSKVIINKTVETGKKISESDKVHDIRKKSIEKISSINNKADDQTQN